MYQETLIGTFTVRANVTVMSGYTKTVIPVDGSFTILPPDDIDLPDPATGANTKTLPLGASVVFEFPVKCKGVRVGYLSGTPKEDLTRRVFRGRRAGDLLLVGDPDLLYIQGKSIMDTKMYNVKNGLSVYNALPLGTQLRSMKQKLYILLPDGCGNIKPWPLKTQFNVIYTKAAADKQYTVTITP
jgi:hypothetical protein